MRKTPVAARFMQQLIRVNDQMCYSALQQWEFQRTLEPLVSSRAADFTPAVFHSNPFAENIFRRIGELPVFLAESEQVALRMGVIAAAEYSIAYIEEVQAFRQKLVASAGDTIKNDAEEEQLLHKIEAWSGNAPVSGYFRTLGYLRLLRNHYAHINEKPHQAFKTYIGSFGTPLNRFWDNGVTDVHGIDFRTLPKTALTPKLIFGIMNIARVSIQHIDDMVARTLTLADAVRWQVEKILQSANNRQLPVERLASKIRARLEMDWKIESGLSEIIREIAAISSHRV